MTPSKTSERLALGAAGLLLVQTLLAGFVAGASRTLPALGVALFAGVGLVIALLSLVHATLRRHADEEERQRATLKDDQAAIFRGEDEADLQVKGRNLRQFERLVLPIGAGTVGLAEALLGIWYLRQQVSVEGPATDRLVVAAVLLLVGAAVLYLLGSYLAGLAFGGEAPTLRAVAGECVGVAALAALAGVAGLVMLTDFQQAGLWTARLFGVLLLIRAAEKLLNVFLEIYRPRQQRLGGWPHESRLNGLIAQPRSVLGGLAETLNYQFGLQLDEARMRGLAWRIVPFVGLQALILLAFSSLVIIGPGEQALVERFGRPLSKVELLEPGLHVKLPWPLDKVYRYNVKATRGLQVGVELPSREPGGAILWGQLQASPDQLYVTANRTGRAAGEKSFNLIAATVNIRYRIVDVPAYAYGAVDAEGLLVRLVREELVRFLAGNDPTAVLGDGEPGNDVALRQRFYDTFNERLQAVLGDRQLGLEVVSAGLVHLQLPEPIVPAHLEQMTAREQRAMQVIAAEEARVTLAKEAAVEAGEALVEAETYAAYHGAQAIAAEVDSFLMRQEAFSNYREVYRLFELLATLEQALAGKRKLILATEAQHEVLELDLKQADGADLLNLGMP